MSDPKNSACYRTRTQINYNSCSWFGLLATEGIELIDDEGNRIAPHAAIVSSATQAAFARAQLIAMYRARGYMTEQEMLEHQIKPDPREWEMDYDMKKHVTIWRARAHDAPPRKTN